MRKHRLLSVYLVLAASFGLWLPMAAAAATVTAGGAATVTAGGAATAGTAEYGPGVVPAQESTGQAQDASAQAQNTSAQAQDTSGQAQNTAPQRRLIPDETSNNYAGKKAEPIFRVRTDKPQVALSFDAGADRGNAEAIMDILEQYGITSTFFLTADWMDAYPEDAKSIVARGHEAGNHSVNHPSFPSLSAEQMNAQIRRTHDRAKDLLGVDMCLFRFPYGDYSNASMDVVKANGYYAIQWSVDSIDWRNEGREIMINRVLNHKNLGNGSIVLMHIAAKYTPSALESIIQGILDRGYEIVPVSELIYESHYHMDAAGNQLPD